ncbi:MAG: hypothetical protein IH987_02660, partial [Planctomycetes bacterium]|nr:hypothetical protein [Planctomycetota bacterium]
NVQGGWTGAGANNLNTDPLFVDADGADDTVGTDDDDLRLQTGSPCIDVGDDGAVTESADLDGNTRVIGCAVDMGAYERQTILDSDGDGVPDGCDVCLGFDDAIDSDGDGVPNGCDVCLGDDATGDSDGDGVCDDIDVCPGFDDTLDADGDGVPDGCDVCPGSDDAVDSDGDGVPDGCDICPGFDDTVDSDGDGVPDGCDVCPGFDDNIDDNANGTPDDCEIPCDIDFDGDVDHTDNAIFVSCMTGPGNINGLIALCATADLDLDDDVDMFDYVQCQTEFTGASAGNPLKTTVTGLVRFSDGSPVLGADVELVGGGPSTVSGNDGRFFLLHVPVELSEISVIASVVIQGEDFLGSARAAELVGGGITDVGIITLSDVVKWVSPADGLWSDDANWDAPFAPGAGLSVIIDVPDAEVTVTRDFAAPNDGPLANLLCNEKLRLEFNTLSVLSVAGSFQMNNQLDLACGVIVDSIVDLGPGALINIVPAVCRSRLDGVTINGNMDLLSNSQILNVLNGLTINGNIRLAGGTGSTGVFMGFQGADKCIDGNGTISFISNPSASGISQVDAGNLHIRSGITIRGAEGQIGRADAPLVHDGLIHSDTSGTLQINGLDWINNGTLRVSGSDSELLTRGSWTNHGNVEATSAGRLILGDTYQNLGTITATDADVRLDGEFTIADLGTFDFVNTLVVIEGTLVNETGLVLEADQFNWKLGKGTALGGTISSADGTTFDLVAGIPGGDRPTLDGVTLDAEMRMFTHGTLFDIRNGLTLNGSIGMSGGGGLTAVSISVLGPNRTIDGTGQIEFLSTGGNTIFQGGLALGDLGVMTIGPGITIVGANGAVGTDGGPFDASLVNQGTIHSDRPGIITVNGTDWVNDGVLKSSGGGVLHARGAWTNNGTVHVGVASPFQSFEGYTQSSLGTLLIDISGLTATTVGKLTVTGTASLNGVLKIEFADTFVPSVGQSFLVLQYSSHVGEFASIEAPSLDPDLTLVPSYGSTGLVLAVAQP